MKYVGSLQPFFFFEPGNTVNSTLTYLFIEYSTQEMYYILNLYSVYSSLWRGNAQRCMYLKYKTYIYIYTFYYEISDNGILVVILIFLPLFPSSKPPPLHYFMPFQNCSCGACIAWRNKHNQHFTLSHNCHTFCPIQILV